MNKHVSVHSIKGISTFKVTLLYTMEMLSKRVSTVCSISLPIIPHLRSLSFCLCACVCWCSCKLLIVLKITSSSEQVFCIAESEWKPVNREKPLARHACFDAWLVCPVKTQGLFSKPTPRGEPSAEVSRSSCIVSVGLTFEVFSNHHHCMILYLGWSSSGRSEERRGG